MGNVALNKPIEEQITNGQQATDGQTTYYTAHQGFASFNWPGTLTVDLTTIQVLRSIRILLWDGLGEGGAIRNPRFYLYRLLASTDHNQWKVVFDTGPSGFNGWQVFNFSDGLEARYIRVHALFNSSNPQFHVVQIEAHDSEPPPLSAEITLQRIIVTHALQEETGDGLPLQSRVRTIINGIEQLVDSTTILNPEPFRQLISQLRVQLTDLTSIERGMDSIRREIIAPVKNELNKAAKLGRFSFWFGIIGGLLAIASIILNIYMIAKPMPSISKEQLSIMLDSQNEILNKLAEIKNYNIGLNPYLGTGPISKIPLPPSFGSHNLKQGSAFTHTTGFLLFVNKINKDNTANVTINNPSEPNYYLQYFENVSTGRSWQLKDFFAEYKFSITKIDFPTNLVKVEIKTIPQDLSLPSSKK
jgi:hypothetical protein